ncbi:MAG TPA: SAM-dependent methyltransferase [Thermoanaerobaculia bacterium]|nr:SAM-dependent methyltransferase [Thermoanaerobaculia bacterium]
MPPERSVRDALRNMLQYGDLSFRDFVEVALYHPRFGYYARAGSPVGKEADYVTSPTLSPVFAYGFGKLVREFLGRVEGGLSSVVDIGCSDGGLIRALASPDASFYGVDRAKDGLRTIDDVPEADNILIYSNELFDAFPFARLVQRGEHLHELWVNAELDWSEHEAAAAYSDYFAERGIELLDGQFADVSLDWEHEYRRLAKRAKRGLIVTFDYGFLEKQLFDPRIRRFGTAASYSRQRVTRDLLANPGEQDLTAHVNFSDLIRAGESEGLTTLYFDRQAKFLLALGITDHPLFTPVTEVEIGSAEEGLALMEAREEARRLVLPDGIGEDIRVLVQGRGMPLDGWSFQRKVF